jgi:hypothetical protein
MLLYNFPGITANTEVNVKSPSEFNKAGLFDVKLGVKDPLFALRIIQTDVRFTVCTNMSSDGVGG